MEALLDNPVFNALNTGDARLSFGTDTVKYFDPEVSPFVGFDANNPDGFSELYDLFPSGRTILFANRNEIEIPSGWKLILHLGGSQFVFGSDKLDATIKNTLVPLESRHAGEMVALAKLTKPGPFNMRTIEFGHYYGVFENERLAAMTGQRLHPGPYSEVSAVCTHPDFAGKGYARDLLNHQVQLILKQGQIPFLHVRSDNSRAIELYEKNGFYQNGPMHFYFLKKE